MPRLTFQFDDGTQGTTPATADLTRGAALAGGAAPGAPAQETMAQPPASQGMAAEEIRDAGPPPQWLFEAVQGHTSPVVADADTAQDGGSAPAASGPGRG